MEPCLNAVHPAKWHPTPVRSCDPGPAAAAVTDRSPVLPIDHVALSAGRPDGLYVAGKQLRDWLSFDERLVLTAWDRDTPERRTEVARITAAARGESVLVQWRIEGGHPGVAEVLTTTVGEGRDQVDGAAYTWGEQRHVHVYSLGYKLIHLAQDEMRRTQTSPAEVPRSSYEAVHKMVAALPPEFVLPVADVCRVIAQANLAQAKDAIAAAKKVAKRWGAG